MATESLVPLESNPEVMNKFLQKLGVPSSWSIVDVMGLEPELLSWVPRPAIAVLLLFPTSEVYEQYRQKEHEELSSKGQKISDKVFYMKQHLSNACGTIALVHSVLNNVDKIKLEDGPLKQYLEQARSLDPTARGKMLESLSVIIDTHKELAQEGQSQMPTANDPVNHHFISFVQVDGGLYELDGRKAFPINHGMTSADTLLEDAAKVCKQFMARDPEEMRFTVVALAASD